MRLRCRSGTWYLCGLTSLNRSTCPSHSLSSKREDGPANTHASVVVSTLATRTFNQQYWLVGMVRLDNRILILSPWPSNVGEDCVCYFHRFLLLTLMPHLMEYDCFGIQLIVPLTLDLLAKKIKSSPPEPFRGIGRNNTKSESRL